MNQIFSDSALDATFQRDGYAAAPFLDSGQVAALLADFETLRPDDGFAPDGSGPARNTYHCTFLDTSREYRHAVFELLSRHFSEAVDRLLTDYRILTASIYVKPPGGGDLRTHQNWPVLPLDETSVTIWCPLVDVDATNGTLHVVPASHKLLPHIESPISPAYFSTFIDRVADYMVALPGPAGRAFVIDDSLVHGSTPNRGTEPRIAAQLLCIPKGADPVYYYRKSEARFERIAADCDFYLDQDISHILERQPGWRGLGHVANRNRLLDEDEFAALLAARGQGARRTRSPVPKTGGRPDLMQQIKRPIRKLAARVVPERAKPVLRRMLGRARPAD